MVWAWVLKRVSGVNWLRVGAGVVVGILIILAARYVWVGRPQEFYDRGVEVATLSETAACEKEKRDRNEEIFKRQQAEQKRRAKILAAPDLDSDGILERMSSGRL